MKKTVVLGASPNEDRYSYKAVKMLTEAGHEVVALGIRKGKIGTIDIETQFEKHYSIDTITLYVGAQNQPQYYDYIIGLKPRRIIFNPGTENHELVEKAKEKGIETIEACTLVMLSLNNY